ncbi:MAG: molybdopterin converting factor subunit 1 [Sulfuricellaceae bacterium]|nr:molybdopterin converting factor subunit 1 [Sulfuricellaceae bacterium]
MITLLYFARLREAFGVASETLELPDSVKTSKDLTDWLQARGGEWAVELAPGRAFRVAVNQEMAGLETLVRDGDEIAIFPPVTGG